VIEKLFRVVSGLSLPLLHRLGSGLGWLTYAASPTYRRRMHAFVDQAGMDWPQARGAVASAGRMVAELPWLWCRPADRPLGSMVRWEGVEHLEAALAAQRGLVMLTPHLGCFEVIAQAYAERFGARSPITVLYRPSRQPWLRELVAQSRQRPGLLTAPATLAGVRQMIRALRQGGTVGLLPDQVPPDGMGVWAPFFGREAYTMTLAARLVQQTGAAWLLFRCERLAGGRGYVIHVSAPSQPMPAADDLIGAASAVNHEMETLIRACPEQYLWSYNRYKPPRAQPVAPAAEATPPEGQA
jgi:KDO2-lipid IV(A) lauroyltransferase